MRYSNSLSALGLCPALQVSVQEAMTGHLTVQRKICLMVNGAQEGKGGGSGRAIEETRRCAPGAAVSRHGSAPDSSMHLLPLQNNFLSGRSAPLQGQHKQKARTPHLPDSS